MASTLLYLQHKIIIGKGEKHNNLHYFTATKYTGDMSGTVPGLTVLYRKS